MEITLENIIKALTAFLEINIPYASGININGRTEIAERPLLKRNSPAYLNTRKTIHFLRNHSEYISNRDLAFLFQTISIIASAREIKHSKSTIPELAELNLESYQEELPLEKRIEEYNANLSEFNKPYNLIESIISNNISQIRKNATADLHEYINKAQTTIQAIESIGIKAKDTESTLASHRSIFLNHLNKQEQQFQEFLSAKNADNEKKLAEIYSRTKNDLDAGLKAIEASAKSTIDRASAAIDEIKGLALNEISPTKEKAEHELAEIQRLKSNTEELIGEITSGASAKHYEDAYKTEMHTRITWQALSLLGFGLAAIIAYNTINILAESFPLSIPDIVSIGARATSIFMVIFFITFCSRQATKHHELEKFNRQMRFELLTLDNYLSPLSNREEKEQARLQLKDNFFGQFQNLKINESASSDQQSLHTSIIELGKALKNLPSKSE